MSKKVSVLLNNKSKYYLGCNLPSDTTIELSNYDLSYMDKSLSVIELNLCKEIINDWVAVHKETGYRKGRFYVLNKRLSLDLGLVSQLHDNKYVMYLHFDN